jgi:hypothetical protein
VAGELLNIGLRPKLVASFDPPGAEEAFRAWQVQHGAVLAGLPPDVVRVEYGRWGDGVYVRVRVDESHLPPELSGAERPGGSWV